MVVAISLSDVEVIFTCFNSRLRVSSAVVFFSLASFALKSYIIPKSTPCSNGRPNAVNRLTIYSSATSQTTTVSPSQLVLKVGSSGYGPSWLARVPQ